MDDTHRVDYAILSFKTEEFEALLSRLDQQVQIRVPSPHRDYEFRQVRTASGREAKVALVRTITQGLGGAQHATTNIIEDLHPRLLIACGIAGGQPGTDVYLGDVVLATHIHDFSLQANTPNGIELATGGFDIQHQVGVVIAGLPAKRQELGKWHTEDEVRCERPTVTEEDLADIGGPEEWKAKVLKAVKHHRQRKHPNFVDGPIGSSYRLLKSAESMRQMLEVDRRILAAEMEAAGVARACKRRDGNTPLLVVRAISDIPELRRSPKYEDYACNVAASFTKALIHFDIVERIEFNSPRSELSSKLDDLLSLGRVVAQPVPATVIQQSLQIELHTLEGLIAQSGGSAAFTGAHQENVDFAENNGSPLRMELVRSVLNELLNFIHSNSRERAGVMQCRNALALYRFLATTDRRILAAKLFDTLDKPMKILGDKQLVIDTANACIEVTTQRNRSPDEAECEARARICGLSWAYQRMGELELAAREATKSLELSQQLNLATNLAFCMKCMGRLERIQAEAEADSIASRKRFRRSRESLLNAIDKFSHHEKFGPEDPEVGDCYSLLGRTCLAMGNHEDAHRYAQRASELIVDRTSKDYLDLAILLGDIASALDQNRDAYAHYREAISASLDLDFQRSEIVARAYLSRAKLYADNSEIDKAVSDFEQAAKIWDTFQEVELAGRARWLAFCQKLEISGSLLQMLEGEPSFAVRVEACQRYADHSGEGKEAILSKRHEKHRPDTQIMKRLLKKVKEDHALRRQKSLF